MQKFINLDYQSTTPPEPLVIKEVLHHLEEVWANPAGRHGAALQAEASVEAARRRAARYFGVTPGEVVFTAGATESNNLAIKGVAHARGRGHLITAATEHKSVLRCIDRLRSEGFETTVLPVRVDGSIDLDHLADSLRPDTLMGSFMLVNNETGVIHPVGEISRILHARGALLHTDATQGLPNMRVDPRRLGIDLLSASGHKVYGPKGVGLLLIDHGAVPAGAVVPEMDGGGQESGVRSGTLNVPAIAGLGVAIEILDRCLERDIRENREKRLAFLASLPAALGFRLNGTNDPAPAILSLTLKGVETTEVMGRLDHLMISAGSACSSAGPPSHVLAAIGHTPEQARCTLRVGFGRFTSLAEVVEAAMAFRQLLGPASRQPLVAQATPAVPV